MSEFAGIVRRIEEIVGKELSGWPSEWQGFKRVLPYFLAAVVFLLWGGCVSLQKASSRVKPSTSAPAIKPVSHLLALQAMEGWRRSGEPRLYDSDTLFDYVNGEAELYFAYNFQALAVQEFEEAADKALAVELWEVAAPEDAYGLFSYYRTGEPLMLGHEGARDPGYRVVFWQSRYYGRVFALRGGMTDETLTAFATRLSALLPQEGEPSLLVRSLPRDGLQADSVKFFHEKLVQDNVIWLGAENILNLSRTTNTVLADYRRDGYDFRLLIVQYPEARVAETSAQAVESADLEGLAVMERSGSYLVLILGKDGEGAQELAAEAARQLR